MKRIDIDLFLIGSKVVTEQIIGGDENHLRPLILVILNMTDSGHLKSAIDDHYGFAFDDGDRN